jgi:hypothetical protein
VSRERVMIKLSQEIVRLHEFEAREERVREQIRGCCGGFAGIEIARGSRG